MNHFKWGGEVMNSFEWYKAADYKFYLKSSTAGHPHNFTWLVSTVRRSHKSTALSLQTLQLALIPHSSHSCVQSNCSVVRAWPVSKN